MKKLILVLVWSVLLESVAGLGARAWDDPGCSSEGDDCCVEEAADVDPDCQTAGVRCDTCEGEKPRDYCCTEKSGCSVTVEGHPPSTISVPIWTYLFDPECRVKRNEVNQEIRCEWTWEYRNCSASDRCEGGPNQSGACQEVSDAEMFSVSNSSGHIFAGQCSASECSEEGCKNGGWFRIG